MFLYSDDYLADIVKRFEKENVEDSAVVDLIWTMAKSGEMFNMPEGVYDFASTGGPSSLSTLLVPLFLYEKGLNVVNLAVPGRPAGAVDVLAQIPKYNLGNRHFKADKNSHFYLHLEVNDRFVPLDKCLFNYRKKHNKVDVPNLVIASILSKKVASGASLIGLDVRMSSFGNFGSNWYDSLTYSEKYNRIASMLGLKSLCFISNANYPYQKYIGRGEALLALDDIFKGQEDNWLHSHVLYCEKIAETMINMRDESSNIMFKNLLDSFSRNIEMQGTSLTEFEKAISRIKNEPRQIIKAYSSGYISYDLKQIRDVIVQQQSMDKNNVMYPDPCGVILLSKPGERVDCGQSVLSVRCQNQTAIQQLQRSFSISQISEVADSRIEVVR